jgi:hypothetical protein
VILNLDPQSAAVGFAAGIVFVLIHAGATWFYIAQRRRHEDRAFYQVLRRKRTLNPEDLQ